MFTILVAMVCVVHEHCLMLQLACGVKFGITTNGIYSIIICVQTWYIIYMYIKQAVIVIH